MSRDGVTNARIADAQQRFRARLAGAKWWERNSIAAATRALSRELAPLDVNRSLALSELAELLEVPPSQRHPPAPAVIPTREADSTTPLPPDMEGDEYLLDSMKRFRTRTPKEE